MSNKVELVILAAGMSTRFGGLKQIAPLDDMNHAMMDYSVFDAFRCHFSAVTFIIREECKDIIKSTLGDKVSKYIEVKYAYQKLENLPKGFAVPEGREKPWGTGQALLSCKGIVNNPFVILNCDDYYNKNVFEVLYDFLKDVDNSKNNWAMIGYDVASTISKNGTVNRGICKFVGDNLISVEETYQIRREGKDIVGKIGSRDNELIAIPDDTKVSMNVWGFTSSIFPILEKQFVEFLKNLKGDREEFGLPDIVNRTLKNKESNVKMLKASNLWFGMTYQSDMDEVKQNIAKLIENGDYPKTLLD